MKLFRNGTMLLAGLLIWGSANAGPFILDLTDADDHGSATFALDRFNFLPDLRLEKLNRNIDRRDTDPIDAAGMLSAGDKTKKERCRHEVEAVDVSSVFTESYAPGLSLAHFADHGAGICRYCLCGSPAQPCDNR